MKFKLLPLLFVVLIPVSALATPQADKKEKVISTHILRGRVTGFETGDYVHVDVKDLKGHGHSFFVDQPQVEYFLALNKSKTLSLTVKKISAFIPEAGNRQTIERVVEVRAGKLTASSWWARELKHSTRAKLIDKYDKLVNPGSPERFGHGDVPVMVAVDGWILGVKTPTGWKAPTKEVSGRTYRFRIFAGDHAFRPRLIGVEYSAGPPSPSVTLKGIDSADPPALYVCGGQVVFTDVKRTSPKDSAALKLARAYAADKGKSNLPVVIEDGMTADLNGDGKLETVLALSSGSTLQTKKASDYEAVALYTTAQGKAKTIELAFNTNFGQMKGPFTSRIVGAGDFAGDGHTGFVVLTKDPWGTEITMYELTKAGEIKKLCSTASGE